MNGENSVTRERCSSKVKEIRTIDERFPPCPDSYVTESDDEENRFDLFCFSLSIIGTPSKWLRMGSYFKNNRMEVEKFMNPLDIKQGMLGTCWLLSALSSIARNPILLRKLMIRRNEDDGMINVKLCRRGRWVTVSVDDCFPFDSFNSPLFSSDINSDMWVAVIEKAAAKLYGNYYNIHSGRIDESLQLLTGEPVQTLVFDWNNNAERQAQLESNWLTIKRALSNGYALTAFVELGKLSWLTGLLTRIDADHAFAILDAAEMSQSLRALKFYNPWGKNRISRLFNYFLFKNEACSTSLHNDSSIWLKYDEIARYVPYITLSKTNSECTEHRFSARFVDVNETVSYFELTTKGRTTVDVEVFLAESEKSNVKESYPDIGLLIFRDNFLLVEMSIDVDYYDQCCINLMPGCYFVIPFSFSSYCTVHSNSYNVAFHSAEFYEVLERKKAHAFLTVALIECCKQKGKVTPDVCGLATLYTINNGGNVCVMIENQSKAVRCRTSFASACALTSSRGSSETDDMIPPNCSSIINVLFRTNAINNYDLNMKCTVEEVAENDFKPILKPNLTYQNAKIIHSFYDRSKKDLY